MGFQTKIFVLLIGLLLGVSAYFMIRSDDLPETSGEDYTDYTMDESIPEPTPLPDRRETAPRPSESDPADRTTSRIAPPPTVRDREQPRLTTPREEAPLIRRITPELEGESASLTPPAPSESSTPAPRPQLDQNRDELADRDRPDTEQAQPSIQIESFRAARPDFSSAASPRETSAPRPAAVNTTGKRTYTIQPGDNFWKIAQTHYGNGTHAAAIVAANPAINPDRLQVGVTITLPELSTSAASPAIRRTASSSSPAPAPAGASYVTVQEGDTLSKIAARTLGSATQWQRIAEANKTELPNPDRLKVGQRLRIPE